LIIGSATIKKQQLSKRLPSHFGGSANLTVPRLTQASFADNKSEELYGYKPSNQVRTERLRSPVKVHAHTYISNLNPDDDTVCSDGPSVKCPKKTQKAEGQDSENENPMYFCSKALPQDSCAYRPDQLLPVQKREGDQMRVTGAEGENDKPLLQPVLQLITESDTPPLPLGNC
jgi:hypothetical protein